MSWWEKLSVWESVSSFSEDVFEQKLESLWLSEYQQKQARDGIKYIHSTEHIAHDDHATRYTELRNISLFFEKLQAMWFDSHDIGITKRDIENKYDIFRMDVVLLFVKNIKNYTYTSDYNERKYREYIQILSEKWYKMEQVSKSEILEAKRETWLAHIVDLKGRLGFSSPPNSDVWIHKRSEITESTKIYNAGLVNDIISYRNKLIDEVWMTKDEIESLTGIYPKLLRRYHPDYKERWTHDDLFKLP